MVGSNVLCDQSRLATVKTEYQESTDPRENLTLPNRVLKYSPLYWIVLPNPADEAIG